MNLSEFGFKKNNLKVENVFFLFKLDHLSNIKKERVNDVFKLPLNYLPNY